MPATPDPDVALQAAKATVDLYRQAVDDLLVTVARRIGRGITEPGWAEAKLLEIAGLRDEVQRIVDRLDQYGPGAITSGLGQAATAGARAASVELGIRFIGTNQLAVAQLARETITVARSANLAILRQVEDAYRTVIAEVGAPGVVTGSLTRRQAAQRALDRFADRGITGFTDAAGRRWQLESYVEMATRTASGRAMVAGTLDRYQQAGRDLVIVSDAPQECSMCRPWEGKVLSITGATAGQLADGVTVAGTVADARAAGLLHANCRHALGAYIPGLTQPFTHTADPAGDLARQEQRRLERGVRHWRARENVALDEPTRRYAAARRQAWERRLVDHIQANDLKRLRYRERPGVAASTRPPTGHPVATRPRRAPAARPAPRPTTPPPTTRRPTGNRAASAAVESMPTTRSEVGRQVRTALEAIERVHRIPDGATVQVQAVNSTRYYGAYDHTPGQPLQVLISRTGDHMAATFAHEFGHFLDHQLLDAAGDFASQTSAQLAGWRAAVDASPSIQALKSTASDAYVRYALRVREIFARSYAQWIATRSGDAAMLQDLLDIRTAGGARALSQWTTDEFEPIAAALDDLFTSKGLMP